MGLRLILVELYPILPNLSLQKYPLCLHDTRILMRPNCVYDIFRRREFQFYSIKGVLMESLSSYFDLFSRIIPLFEILNLTFCSNLVVLGHVLGYVLM